MGSTWLRFRSWMSRATPRPETWSRIGLTWRVSAWLVRLEKNPVLEFTWSVWVSWRKRHPWFVAAGMSGRLPGSPPAGTVIQWSEGRAAAAGRAPGAGSIVF